MNDGNNGGWPAAQPASEEAPLAGIGDNSGNTAWPEAQQAVEVTAPKYPVVYPGQPETEEPEHFRLRRNAELQNWLTTRETLATAKTDEMAHRNKITGTLFPTPKKGTQRYDMGGGFQVKLVYTLNYKIGNKDAVDEAGAKVSIRNQVEELEERVSAMGEAHRIAFERVVKWVPEVSGSEYEKLDANDPIQLAVRNEIDKLLTIEPGSPQLAFEEPKEPK